MRNCIIIFLSLLVLIFTECKKDKYKPIDSDIVIDIVESGENYVQLECSTEKIYGCTQPIITKVKRLGKSITIKYLYIDTTTACLMVLGPAKTTIKLDNLNKDSYNLKFQLNGITTKGKLTKNPFNIELEENSNIKKN